MSGLGTLHILLVDDNANMRSILSTMLKSVGVGRISEAENRNQAFELVHSHAIDIAIVDFRMEPVDGVALTRLFRNETISPHPYLPIIMMTGHSERSRVTEARDAGVTEFVTKPVIINDLMKKIEAVILKPRAFVRTETFFGPDRRRTTTLDYEGPFRREGDLQSSLPTFSLS